MIAAEGELGVRPQVVLIHRYFSPDTPPYATILKEIALGLGADGMDVTVLTCQPSYNPAVAGRAQYHEHLTPHVDVRRWRILADRSSTVAKIANLIIFSFRVAVTLMRMRKVDAVMAASTPPVLVALVVSVVAKIKRAPFVYHKQDIYPEVTNDAGGSLPRAARQLLQRTDAGTDRRSARIVVLSRDMADTVARRGADRQTVWLINNFDPWTLPIKHPIPPDNPPNSLRFVYAGNLGRFQNLEHLAQAIGRLGDDTRFSFDFIGDGPMRSWLERFVADRGLSRVRVHGYLSPEVLAEMLRSRFDVGVLSLHPGVIRSAYPSKMMSYLRNGLPVLALVEENTDLVDTLTQYKAGWAADPAVPEAVEQSFEEIFRSRETIPTMREEAHRMYQAEFSRSDQLRRWRTLFREITGGPR
jgi:glycosyltransferase involved in cell wall biosynthesis